MNQTLSFDDGSGKVLEGVFPAPDRLAEPGDLYEFTRLVCTKSGREYRPGDRMHVLERTEMVPYGHKSSLGNLVLSGPYGTSVWSCFELGIVEGWVKLVGSDQEVLQTVSGQPPQPCSQPPFNCTRTDPH